MGERLSKCRDIKSSKPFDNSFSNFVIIKINNIWYDLTNYLETHPGSGSILKHYHLRDGTEPFNKVKSHKFAFERLEEFKITDIDLINKLDKLEMIY
jgi:cytochrome b involved in lipid metabolism